MMNFTIFENETTGRESFVDLFTSNIAIIIYIIFIALAIIGIAVLFIVNESLTNEKIQKINTDSTVILDKNGRRIRPNGENEEKSVAPKTPAKVRTAFILSFALSKLLFKSPIFDCASVRLLKSGMLIPTPPV